MYTEIQRLENLRHILQSARDTEHRFPSAYVDGLNAGLDIALYQVTRELEWARESEARATQTETQ